ncbi:ATP-binding protein [Haloarcula salinisoli]|uniref:histidine kinase n=1 Tax=Haloarcula salinisoli TaxID=2487746 RepID=A0A8J8C6V2_9EURY|nr:ATP-binding protein [Halomicroarcula salinisoli]MBX0302681.1 GAF domain-containing protein [Halomicroarcula salinisoli]
MTDGTHWVATDGGRSRDTGRLDPLFDVLPDPAVLVDFGTDEPRVRRINDAFARAFGHDTESVVEEPLDELLGSPSSEAVRGALAGPADGVCEVRRETVEGREREYLFRRVRADGSDQVYGLYTDITERTAHEANLTALHETARELMAAETTDEVVDIGVNAARDVLGFEINAIYRYDEETDTLDPAATTARSRELLGEPPSFPSGSSIAWRAFETGDAVICDDVREDPDVFNPSTPFRSELLLPLGDYGVLVAGSTEPATFKPTDRSLGQVLAANIQSGLQQASREETLREREQALARQNERLEEFASIVSHDLRTPLDLAGAHLELAAEDSQASDHLDDVAAAHRRMSELIDDVLTWAREGDAVESTEPVSLPALLSACWADRQPDGATLEITTERTVPADRSRLRQLFDNLLDNAVTHAGPAATIRVGDIDGGVYVADDGPGIPPDERDAIFDFGHALAAESTGFGLAIVGEIVEAHGWSISVTESERGGARFEIQF